MLNTCQVKLVGVGPGDPDYVTVRVAHEVVAADVVAGFATVLAVVDHFIKGQRIVLTYRNQEEQLAEVAQAHAEGKRCVVCCYGDLNFSAQELIARVERHCGVTERIPGISSVQVASARSALAMEETLFFTLHARAGIEEAKQEIIAAAAVGKRHLIILPLPWSFMPPQIAQMLIAGGIAGDRPVTVHQRLTLPDESSLHTTLQQLAAWQGEFSDLSIVVLFQS
jgi:precorrin-6y C5,15-methyltransferase (decarboxylating) CbiE subunit